MARGTGAASGVVGWHVVVRVLGGALLVCIVQACGDTPVTVAAPGADCTFQLACGVLSSTGDCSNIAVLNLADKGIAGLADGVFTGMDSLEMLNLGWNQIADNGLPGSAFAGLANLKKLYLYSNKLETLSKTMLEGLALEQLSLTGNVITSMSPDVFRSIESMIAR